MGEADQIAMRNELLAIAFKYIDKDIKFVVPAFVACMGAAAIVAAVLPKPARDKLIEAAEENLSAHADKRAEEMRSGALDRELAGH